MHILITGGAGFIGSHLAEFHLKRGDDVVALDNLTTGSKHNVAHLLSNQQFTLVIDDILTWDNLAECVAWADRIYHMAAMVGMYHLLAHPVQTLETNIFGCERLLRTISQHNTQARLLLASSSEIYGPSDKELLNENDLLLFKSAGDSKWVYATSKFTEEIFALTYARTQEVNVALIRFFNTIGPRQNGRYGMVVPRFIEQAVTNQPFTVYGDGEQTRSFCDVRDTVEALNLIAENPDAIGEIINLGQDQPITINQLALLIKRLAKSSSEINHIPYDEAYGQPYEDILHRRPDLKKFNLLTHYQHHWNLEKSLLDLIQLKRATT